MEDVEKKLLEDALRLVSLDRTLQKSAGNVRERIQSLGCTPDSLLAFLTFTMCLKFQLTNTSTWFIAAIAICSASTNFPPPITPLSDVLPESPLSNFHRDPHTD